MAARRQITGFSNPTVKYLRSLRDKKHRRREGKFLAEGLRLLTDARESGRLPEMLVMAAERDPHPLLAALEADVERAGGEIVETSADILAKITGKDNPQTVAGVFAEFDTSLAALDRSKAPIWLVAQALREKKHRRRERKFLAEAADDQRDQLGQAGVGLFAFDFDLDRVALGGAEHHQAEDRAAEGAVAVLADPDRRSLHRRRGADEAGARPCMEAALVDDFDRLARCGHGLLPIIPALLR